MKKSKSLKLRDVKPVKDPKGGKFRPKHKLDGGDGTGRPGPAGFPRKTLP